MGGRLEEIRLKIADYQVVHDDSKSSEYVKKYAKEQIVLLRKEIAGLERADPVQLAKAHAAETARLSHFSKSLCFSQNTDTQKKNEHRNKRMDGRTPY